jgi:hypothetical protein
VKSSPEKKKSSSARKASGDDSNEIVRAEVLLKQKVRRSDEYQRVMQKRLRRAKTDQKLYEKTMFECAGGTFHASSCPTMQEKCGVTYTEEFSTLRTDFNEWSWRLWKKQHDSERTPTDRLKEVIKLGARVKKSFRRYERQKLGLPPLLPDEKLAAAAAKKESGERKAVALGEVAKSSKSSRERSPQTAGLGASSDIIVVKDPWRPTSRELQDI